MCDVGVGQGLGGLGGAAWRGRIIELEAGNAGLRAERDRWQAEAERLGRANERLTARVAELTELVDSLRRATKRQAAPFSRNTPTRDPKRPGRKPGAAYGTRAYRRAPERVDRVVTVGLPGCCPTCGGPLVADRVACQFQEELPALRVTTTRFDIEVGHCGECGRRVQPRHPEQTSDALGAAACGLGPRAVALAAWLNKELGLPAAKVARVLEQLGGLHVTPGGVQQALARLAGTATPTYQALLGGLRASPVVAPDETGWRVGGRRAWLWAFVGDNLTVYRIAPGRGHADAVVVLGEEYAGVLERDGWAPYRTFTKATHQSCLAHLLRRCRGLIDQAVAGQARVPHGVRRVLLNALALRDAHQAGTLTDIELTTGQLALAARLDALLAWQPTHPPNRRLLTHLRVERPHLFTFLTRPGVQATNWRAEQAIRPAVVARKHWGGNKTWKGATTWQVLTSVLRTCHQQHIDPIQLLIGLQQQPTPAVAGGLTLPGGTAVQAVARPP